MIPPITVLKASDNDKEEIFELHRELFHQEIEERWGWDEQWQKDNFDKEWKRDVFEIAEHEDQMIGYIHFTREEEEKIYLQNIGISSNFRNQGFGEFLLKRVLKYAQKMKSYVELSVHTKNEVALSLYKKHGFEIIQTESKAHLMRSNEESLTRQVRGITSPPPAARNPSL